MKKSILKYAILLLALILACSNLLACAQTSANLDKPSVITIDKPGTPPGPAAEPQKKKISSPGRYEGYSEQIYDEVVRTSRYIYIRGNNLAINIYRPAKNGIAINEAYPVIFENQRYQRGGRSLPGDIDMIEGWVKHGYVVAILDPRGAGASFGTRTQGDWGLEEAMDGRDVIEWLAAQPFCNGKVGMWGNSYMGGIQYLIAAMKPPHLFAIIPRVATIDQYFRCPNGVVWTPPSPPKSIVYPLDMAGTSANPPQNVDADPNGIMLTAAVAEHEDNIYSDQEWVPFNAYRNQYKPEINNMNFIAQSAITYADDIKASGVAIYNIGGWYDAAPAQALAAWKLWGGKVIIGPWAHGTSLIDTSVVEHQRWYDYYLKGIKNGIANEPGIYYYTINKPEGEEWQFTSEWPLPNIQMTKFYLDGGTSGTSASINDGKLVTSVPTAFDAKDNYTVDYSIKVFEEGGKDIFKENARVWDGDMEQCTDKKGLTYTTAPLSSDMLITGTPVVHLWASASVTDHYFFAFIEEVGPDGKSHYVTNGMIKASNRAESTQFPWTDLGMPYHRGYDVDSEPLVPGQAVTLNFDTYPTSYVFRAGNSIRITITGAFQSTYKVDEIDPAPTLSIYRDADHASYLELPVVPAKK